MFGFGFWLFLNGKGAYKGAFWERCSSISEAFIGAGNKKTRGWDLVIGCTSVLGREMKRHDSPSAHSKAL